MLCAACSNLWSTVRTNPPGSWDGEEPTMFEYSNHGLTWSGAHHTTPDAFLAAVKQNCYICCTIYRDSSPELRKQARTFRSFYQFRMLEKEDGSDNQMDRYQLDFTVEILQVQAPFTKAQMFECTGNFKILPRCDISVPSKPLKLTENTFTSECRDQVKDWLMTCLNSPSHQRCQQDWRTERRDPKRLINIAQTGRFSLETFDGQRPCPSYVTLSHCWDMDVMILKLEKKTEEALKQGMETEVLPVRFQHAIEIAQWMDINYIWIDALCIVQDSDTDWLEQSTRMGDIYTNSYCNIAATKAGRNMGCFTKRMTEMVEPYAIANPRSTDPSATHVIGYDDFWSNSLTDTPLHNRGWVLQERMLSRRTIHFGQEQIFWECRCEMACEAYPEGIPEQFRNHKTRAWRLADGVLDLSFNVVHPTWWQSSMRYLMKIVRSVDPSATSAQLAKVYTIWSKTVERYMECKLSYRQDKLVAISGIAQKIAAITGEEYLAGLWNNSLLPQSLLWFVVARRQADNTPAIRKSAPEYIGPTWSWASLEARVLCNWPAKCGEVLVDVINTHVEEVNGSKLGRVVSASIDVYGSLFEGTLAVMNKEFDGAPKEDGQYLLRLMSRRTDAVSGAAVCVPCPVMEPRIHLDTSLMPDSSSVKTFLLPICTEWHGWSGGANDKLAGLLLVRCTDSPAEHRYTRIGVFGMDQSQAKSLVGVLSGESGSVEEALSAMHKSLVTLL